VKVFLRNFINFFKSNDGIIWAATARRYPGDGQKQSDIDEFLNERYLKVLAEKIEEGYKPRGTPVKKGNSISQIYIRERVWKFCIR